VIFDRLLVVNCAVCIAMQFFGGVNYILILFEYNTDNTFFSSFDDWLLNALENYNCYD